MLRRAAANPQRAGARPADGAKPARKPTAADHRAAADCTVSLRLADCLDQNLLLRRQTVALPPHFYLGAEAHIRFLVSMVRTCTALICSTNCGGMPHLTMFVSANVSHASSATA